LYPGLQPLEHAGRKAMNDMAEKSLFQFFFFSIIQPFKK
jgi:hypothetical protein